MRFLYSAWCVFCFAFWYTVLFPLSFVGLQREAWLPFVHRINRLVSQLFLLSVGVSVEIEYRYRPDPKQTYVFCANHFSYFDIMIMGVIIENYFAFIGKEDVKKIPLFGYMFAKMHINVKREDGNSRVSSLNKSLKTLAKGRSVMVFPEGGMKTKNPPQMHQPLQNGAFQIAIQQQVPIVPITLLNNYQILPDRKPLRMTRLPARVVVHEPLSTTGLTQQDRDALRQQCFDIIQQELNSRQFVV